MNDAERRIREELPRLEVPDELGARERAWRVVQAGFDERQPVRQSRRLRRHALQVALALGILAVLISPAGAAVRDWVSEAVSPGRAPSAPALTSLPGGGSLLVQSSAGPWVVHADGSKRLLGDYSDATWSPRGLYLGVVSRHELAAIEPGGDVHWSLGRAGPVRLPSWNGPDGYRVAYLDGSALRVVSGDGTGDHPVRAAAAAVAPAWRPRPPALPYVLTFARPDGAVETLLADSGRRLYSTGPGAPVEWLQWSRGGGRLLVVRPAFIELRDPRGRVLWRLGATRGARILTARLSPRGDRVALLESARGSTRALLARPGARSRTLFVGPGSFTGIEWSPNGRWILLAWRSADQWLFLPLRHPKQIQAVSNISAQFAPGGDASGPRAFPAIRGWCCSR